MFKAYANISQPISCETFHRRGINCNSRINSEISMPNIGSVFRGSEIVSYLDPKIWDIVTLKLKESLTLKKGVKYV